MRLASNHKAKTLLRTRANNGLNVTLARQLPGLVPRRVETSCSSEREKKS